jgi:hypothetical protein
MGLLSKLSDKSQGVIPSSLKYLFEYFQEVKEKEEDYYFWYKYSGLNSIKRNMEMSLLQVYLENAIDLLNPASGNLQIKENPVTIVLIENLFLRKIISHSFLS